MVALSGLIFSNEPHESIGTLFIIAGKIMHLRVEKTGS